MSLRCHRRLALLAALATALGLGCADDEAATAEPWMVALRAAEQAFRQQQWPQAEAAFRQAVRAAEASGSAVRSATALEGLATSRAMQGDLAAADSLYRQVLQMQTDRATADSLGASVRVRILGSLGEISLRRGRADEAAAFFQRILDLAATGAIDLLPEEPALAYTLGGLSQARAVGGDTAGAATLQARAQGLQLYAQGFGALVGEDLPGAEQAYRQALAQQTGGTGVPGAESGRTAHALARLLELRSQDVEALRLYEQAAWAYAADDSAPIDHAATLRDWAAALPVAAGARADSLRQRAADLLAGLEAPR